MEGVHGRTGQRDVTSGIHLGVMVRIRMPMKRFFQSGNGTQWVQLGYIGYKVTALEKGTYRRLSRMGNQEQVCLWAGAWAYPVLLIALWS